MQSPSIHLFLVEEEWMEECLSEAEQEIDFSSSLSLVSANYKTTSRDWYYYVDDDEKRSKRMANLISLIWMNEFTNVEINCSIITFLNNGRQPSLYLLVHFHTTIELPSLYQLHSKPSAAEGMLLLTEWIAQQMKCISVVLCCHIRIYFYFFLSSCSSIHPSISPQSIFNAALLISVKLR